MRILSLGAGVQSTTVLLMSLEGELPWIDHAIFADTGWEPGEVYRHLSELKVRCAAAGLPLHVVSAGNIRDHHTGGEGVQTLKSGPRAGRWRATIPFFLDNGGPAAPSQRACTNEFKIQPVQRKIREIMRDAGVRHVDHWYGISLDEVQRMRTSRTPTITTNVYPLVDARMTRHDCQRWLTAYGITAPRSACIGCPYHSDDEWRRIRERPDEWADAVAFDHEVREHQAAGRYSLRGVPYLHRSLQPLDQVDLSTREDHGQGSLFGAECEGMCGV